MIIPILEIYKILKEAKPLFEEKNLKSDFFIDLFRGQPGSPEMFEEYGFPALFIEYSITGQGKSQPRMVQLTLHLELNENYDASNISENNVLGMQRFLYVSLLQQILEGKKLGNTTPLRFESERPIMDGGVTDYHTLVFTFEAYYKDLVETTNYQLGEFESVDLTGKLKQKKRL